MTTSRLRGTGLFALLIAGATAIDCGQSSGPAPAPPPAGFNQGDRADNGVLAIDKARITGSLDGSTLKVSVPIRAVGAQQASGTLHVRLMDVQGRASVADTALSYTLAVGGSTTLETTLPAPTGVTAQADLALWNVRVDDDATNTLRVTRSALLVVPPYEVWLEGPSAVTLGKDVSYRVRAQDPVTRQPVAGAKVSLDLVAKDGTNVSMADLQTSATGEAFFPLSVAQAGDFQVRARGAQNGVTPSVQDAVTSAAAGPKIFLTSDKPIYQPGQTLHLRSLALTAPDNKPVASAPVLLEVEDGKGNKVFKQTVTTDPYGVAATTFTLGTLVNTGTFTLRATSGAVKTEKTVSVSTYALPKFDVAVATDKTWYRAGDALVGTIDARYFFGKNVAGGNVVVQASSLDVGQTPFQKVVGTLDGAGHFQFTVNVPRGLVGTTLGQGSASIALAVTVTDTAGQTVEKDSLVTVSPNGVNVALVPEATDLVAGLDNELDLFVTDPLGAPIASAPAAITAPDGQTFAATTDAFGQAAVVWHAPDGLSTGPSTSFQVQVTPPGSSVSIPSSFTYTLQTGTEHLIVRTDASVYKFGDTVKVDVVASDAAHDVYVDWLNAGQAIAMRTLPAAGGHATFSMNVDASLTGSNRIEAYVVDASGNIVRAGRTVFVTTDSSLAVSMTQDKPTYTPGSSAKLTFAVQDAQGKPAVAALGVEIVDQSVFALVDAHPGLLRSFFELESTYSTPTYAIAAPPVDFNQLLFGNDTDPAAASAHQTLTKAAFAALGAASVTGIAKGSWADVVAQYKTLLQPAYTAATSTLTAAAHALANIELGELEADGCDLTDIYSSCDGQPTLGDALAARMTARFAAWDYWGDPFVIAPGGFFSMQLTTNGPDEVAGTADDQTIPIDLSDLNPQGQGAVGSGLFGGADGGALALSPPQGPAVTGAAGGAGSSSGGSSGGNNSGSGSASSDATGPRVRQDFPETLYVNPSIITGTDGTASIDVPLADNITEWRVSTMANSADGKLGGGESGFQVFQEFFADVNFPATLTRGDQVSFPIAVYNYRTDAQTVVLTLAPDDWYTPTASTSLTVTLQPQQVTGVSFPVTVDKVGMHSLTVKAVGTSASDAVARTVQVLPDGQLFADTSSGVLASGATADHSFQFPAQAVAGSQQLFVEVYPAFLAQAVNGMESLLRQPSGCFEQTTSTTWPNVLVLAYLIQTNKLTPDVQIKAESLISTGYQRLLTFEHPGGGFSWFGTQDPAANVSVTAFGLMEFGDMAKVATVDDAMIARTRAWLLAQQQADGSWLGATTESFSFNTSTARNTAFVLWALGSIGYTGPEVAKGVAYLRAHASDTTNDAYTLALMANALELAAPGDAATGTVYTGLDALKQTSGDQVHWDTGGTQTSFYQSGLDSDVSSTALATNALLQRGGGAAVDGALKYIAAQKDPDGNFGSTQATIWALRALLLAASKTTDGGVGALTISVDGVVAQTLSLTADQSDVMTTVDLSGQASSGSHDVSVNFAGTGKVSFNAVGKYNLPWSLVPPPPAGPLAITVAYDKTSLYVNETVKETVTVHNNTASTQNMVLATLGIPPGFSVATADLDALVAARTLSKYEVTGKQVILYISQIAPSADVLVPYGLAATMPIVASDGAGEAHLYYQPTVGAHTPAQTLQVFAAQ
jgi:uncharacterized protein YfaS (alpha-2-macroglobulin family)